MKNLIVKQRQRGMTMIELVVALGIVAILLSIGIPSYSYVATSSRISGEVNQLFSDMQFARTDAIREGGTVICISTDGSTCLAGAGVAWSQGWIVCSDPNSTGTCAGGTQGVWRYQPAFAAQGNNPADTFNADQGTSAVTFNREGFATLANVVTVTLHAVPVNANSTRCLRVELSGAVRTQMSGQGNCL